MDLPGPALCDEPRFQKGNNFLSLSCEALVSLDVFIPHVPVRSYLGSQQPVQTNATAAMLLPVMSSMPRTIQWVRDTGYYLTQTDEGKDGISVNMRCYDRVLYQKNFASYRLLHQAPPADGSYGNNWNNPGRDDPNFVDKQLSGVILMRNLKEAIDTDSLSVKHQQCSSFERRNQTQLEQVQNEPSHILLLCRTKEVYNELKACLQQF